MANILVIDDDKEICEGLTEFITQMGHSVECALLLKEGLEKIQKEFFDLVFLDVHLPDGNGLSVLPAIRSKNKEVGHRKRGRRRPRCKRGDPFFG